MNSNYHDYIPRTYARLQEWGLNFVTILAELKTTLGFSNEQVNEIAERQTAFETLNAAADSANATKSDIFRRREKAEAYTQYLRGVVNQHLRYNPQATDDVKLSLGLTVPSGSRTPVETPKTRPVLEIRMPHTRQLEVHFKDEGAEHRAKPAGVLGAVLRYGFADEMPTDIKQLPASTLDTKSPFTVDFAPADRGKKVWFAAAWQNSKGKQGSWSDFYEAIVP